MVPFTSQGSQPAQTSQPQEAQTSQPQEAHVTAALIHKPLTLEPSTCRSLNKLRSFLSALDLAGAPISPMQAVVIVGDAALVRDSLRAAGVPEPTLLPLPQVE